MEFALALSVVPRSRFRHGQRAVGRCDHIVAQVRARHGGHDGVGSAFEVCVAAVENVSVKLSLFTAPVTVIAPDSEPRRPLLALFATAVAPACPARSCTEVLAGS